MSQTTKNGVIAFIVTIASVGFAYWAWMAVEPYVTTRQLGLGLHPTAFESPKALQPTKRSAAIPRAVDHRIVDGCSIDGADFSTKGKQLILTILYSIVSKHRWPHLYTLHCGVVGIDSAYRGYRPGKVTYRTFVGGLSNEIGGIDIKWKRAYELGAEVEYKYMCSCTSVPVGTVGRVRTNYLNFRPE